MLSHANVRYMAWYIGILSERHERNESATKIRNLPTRDSCGVILYRMREHLQQSGEATRTLTPEVLSDAASLDTRPTLVLERLSTSRKITLLSRNRS